MPQQEQLQQDDQEAAELEFGRLRALRLGYIFANVPTSLEHAKAQSKTKESQFMPENSQSSPPSRPATMEPSYSQFNRPNFPHRPSSDPAPDNDLSGTVGFTNEGEDPYLSPEDDPSQQIIGMYSPNKQEWIGLQATLDTGANGNWITERSLRLLNIEAQPNSARPWEMDSFGGKTIRSQRQVRIQWTGPAGQKTYRTDFRVAEEGAPFDVILGKEFLFGEDIITFNKSVLLFVRNAKSEAEEKKIAERKAEEDAANQALEDKRLQDNALKVWLAKNSKNQGGNSRGGQGSGSRGGARSGSGRPRK